MSDYIERNTVFTRFEVGGSWAILTPIEQSIKRKIEAVGKPLKEWDVKIYRGILTGCNEAFIIDGAKKDELIKQDVKSAEIIRPILRGRDIKRYGYDFADKWLIATFPSCHYNIENYPAVKKHLLSFGMERLEQTGKTYIINGREVKARKKTNNKWFETQDSISYWEEFNKQKIVWADIANGINTFYLDNGKFIPVNTCYILTHKDEGLLSYIMGFLNSKISLFYMSIISASLGNKGYRWFKEYVELLPLSHSNIQNDMKAIMNNYIKDSNNFNLDKKLNDIFYNLYNLNIDEKIYLNNFKS